MNTWTNLKSPAWKIWCWRHEHTHHRNAYRPADAPGGRSRRHGHPLRRGRRAGRLAPAQLREYFAGTRRTFDLPLAPRGTAFQQRVWAALRAIPYGETCTYGELAAAIGSPSASRAVGMANHHNPIPIVIPCHRVIGANGTLTGYAGGLEIKRKLLALEGITILK